MAIACIAETGLCLVGTVIENYSLRGKSLSGRPAYEKSALETAGRIMQFVPTVICAGIFLGVPGVAAVLPFATVPLVDYFQESLVLSGVELYIDLAIKAINLVAVAVLINVTFAAVLTESMLALFTGLYVLPPALLMHFSLQRRLEASLSLRVTVQDRTLERAGHTLPQSTPRPVQGTIHTLERPGQALPQSAPLRPVQGTIYTLERPGQALPQNRPFVPFAGEGHSLV